MSSTISLEQWRTLIKTYAEVASHPGVYVLGCFARHVTLYSQQARAFNLVYGLHVLGRVKEGTRVAVIGAGAAGLAAAAALSHLGCDVTLLEKNGTVFNLQATATHRWIHPRIYDWPFRDLHDDLARLPIFNWEANSADEVVGQIKRKWKNILASSSIKAHFVVSNFDLSRNKTSKSYRLSWDQNVGGPHSAEFDRVVLAIGFGLEPEKKPSISYWDGDNLDAGNRDLRGKRWLISGLGDGALADLMRSCCETFSYIEILRELEATVGIGGLKEELKNLHSDTRLSDEDLSKKFYDLSTDTSSGKLEHKLKPFLRQQGPEVFLTGKSPDIYGRGSSILNRLIVLLLSRLGAFTHIPGPSGDITPVDDRYQVHFEYPAAVEVFDRVIVRHGTVPVIKPFAKQHMGENSCAKLEKAWSQVAPESDISRVPQWPLGFFGPEEPGRGRVLEHAVKSFGVKMAQLSFYNELRGDGGSTVTYAIDGLTTIDKPLKGMHFCFESYAGKVGLPILGPNSDRLGISWVPDEPPPDGTESMDTLRKKVRKISGTVLFKKALGPKDPPMTFTLKFIVLNGVALSSWEFEQLYEPEDRSHVDNKRLRVPKEYFSRLVWCPVETLKIQVTLPHASFGPVTSSMFSLPTDCQIEQDEVFRDSIVHLYPRAESKWNPNGGDWERQADKDSIDTMELTNPSAQTWILTVKNPPVGSCYSIDWDLPTAVAFAEAKNTDRESKELRSRLLLYGQSHGVADGFPDVQKRAIRRDLVLLHRQVQSLQSEMSFIEDFDIELMTYHEDERKLRLVDEIRNGKPVPRPSDLWFPYGLGLAGACYRQGDAPYFYYRSLVNEGKMGPEYYLDTRKTKAHRGMVSIPLVHPDWYGPEAGETIEPSRLCIGVVDISFEREPRWLKALRSTNEAQVVRLREVCQNFCDQLCAHLSAAQPSTRFSRSRKKTT